MITCSTLHRPLLATAGERMGNRKWNTTDEHEIDQYPTCYLKNRDTLVLLIVFLYMHKLVV